MKAVVIYWSKTGNTEKVARALAEGLEGAGTEVTLRRSNEAEDIDFYAYDLVCVGAPSYRWRPPRPMEDWMSSKFETYRKQGRLQIGSPRVPGKYAVVFCTYSGPHTGINEAIPAGKCMGQYLDHLGFTVLDEWYVVGEFHGSLEASTLGRLGDIRGRPNQEDLDRIREDAALLADRIRAGG